MTQDNWIKLAVTLGALALLCGLETLVNCRRDCRGRQAPLPVVALVYGAIAAVVLSLRRDWAQSLCQQEFLTNGDILMLNVLLMIGFLLVKCVARPIIAAKGKDHQWMESVAAGFYEYDETYGQWFLQRRWAGFRGIMRVFVYCAAGVSTVLLAATWICGPESAVWIYAFPCAALTVLLEIRHFLGGQTREEFAHTVMGDEADARREGNYYRIREIYEKLFAPQMLASHTGCEFSARQGTTQLLKEMERSEDAAVRNTAKYFLTRDSREIFDADCVQAAATMMRGKSVVFFNPFYRDLGSYLTLPVVNTLLRGKKCLVVAARSSTGRDAVTWLTELLRDYSHLRSMWRVRELDKEAPDCEVGVLSFRQMYDVEVLAANRPFFGETEFVLLLEPSLMINTGQIGLSILTEEICRYDSSPVYCICDRYTDGLVDTMSHLLHTEITNVTAMPVPRCTYTGMAWNADGDFMRQRLFDKQTRFLGNGLELAAAAVKNQIPQVTWYGETKAPLRDLKWIAGQHYATLCRYMNLPAQQKSLYEKIRFVPGLWSSAARKEQFIIAEDEFCSLFSMMRAFLSRGKDQVFVNVLSENYLLRDYMRCNQQMFFSNPNAIPSLVPDYAKTERNTLLKLVILMAIRPVSEAEAAEELRLAGCGRENTFETLSRLLRTYTFADSAVLEIKTVTDETDPVIPRTSSCYGISRADFDRYFAASLKNAYYIVEEETPDSAYIDARMFGHVTQTILPGQFVTYDGKYYEVRMISPESGIILRRASDLYTARRYYRQIRTYRFSTPEEPEVVFSREVMDVETTILRCSFSVVTSGYLELRDNHDLRLAREVRFDNDPRARNYDRQYRNKDVLRIRLPDTDDKIRFTLCLLLSEIFRSVFPSAWQYLAVTAKRPADIDGMLNYMVYTLEGVDDDACIYVIEDSDIDLGLLDAVTRNLPQLLEIVADFLDWHFEKMREPERADPVMGDVKLPADQAIRRSRFLKMAERIRALFTHREPEPAVDRPVPTAQSPTQDPEPAEMPEPETEDYALEEQPEKNGGPLPQVDSPAGEAEFDLENQNGSAAEGAGTVSPAEDDQPDAEAEKRENNGPEPQDNADADLVHIDGTDIFEGEGMPDDDIWLKDAFDAAGVTPVEKTRYQKECYLKFGFEEIDGRLRIEDLHRYLRVRGCGNSALTQARKRAAMEQTELDLETANHCDFCQAPLSGVSYERLNDGRIRCNDCSASAITTVEDFQELFYRVLDMMEGFYNIRYQVPIRVGMTDARTVARGAGQIFRPSTAVAARVLGFAQRKGGHYSLLIENGSPRLAAIDTIVHEMTHIWQYLNWNDGEIRRLYGEDRNREIVYEGMAAWAAVQFLYQMGETFYAERQERLLAARDDVYGEGFRLYREKYPLVKDLSLLKFSPFAVFPPL